VEADKITIFLFFTGVTGQKTFQNFYQPLGLAFFGRSGAF
jgi:hypothetical protein